MASVCWSLSSEVLDYCLKLVWRNASHLLPAAWCVIVTHLCIYVCMCLYMYSQELKKDPKEGSQTADEPKEEQPQKREKVGNVAGLVQRISTLGIPTGAFQPPVPAASKSKEPEFGVCMFGGNETLKCLVSRTWTSGKTCSCSIWQVKRSWCFLLLFQLYIPHLHRVSFRSEVFNWIQIFVFCMYLSILLSGELKVSMLQAGKGSFRALRRDCVDASTCLGHSFKKALRHWYWKPWSSLSKAERLVPADPSRFHLLSGELKWNRNKRRAQSISTFLFLLRFWFIINWKTVIENKSVFFGFFLWQRVVYVVGVYIVLLVVLVLLCNHSELSVTTYDPEGDGMHGLTEFMILFSVQPHRATQSRQGEHEVRK